MPSGGGCHPANPQPKTPHPYRVNRPAKMGASSLEALSVPLKAVNSFVSLFAKPQKVGTILSFDQYQTFN